MTDPMAKVAPVQALQQPQNVVADRRDVPAAEDGGTGHGAAQPFMTELCRLFERLSSPRFDRGS